MMPLYTLVAFKPSYITEPMEDSFGEKFLLLEGLQESELIHRIAELRLQVLEPHEPAWDTIRYFGPPRTDEKYVEAAVQGVMAPVLEARRVTAEEEARLQAIERTREDVEHAKKALKLITSINKLLKVMPLPNTIKP